MFLAVDQRMGMHNWVFVWEDPRKAGFTGEVIEDVVLDYDMEHVHVWPDGHRRPEAVLGRNPKQPKFYKVFKYRNELQEAGFEPLPGNVFPTGSWSQYAKIFNIPAGVDEAGWHDYLDELDEESRRRRAAVKDPDPPGGVEQTAVAGWVARKHMNADSSIRAVLHLPGGAAPREIRLLEVNDRISGGPLEPIEFGLDVQGRQFQLLVADVTSEQLDKIKHDPSLLPVGWSLKDGQVWRRRE